MIIGDLKPLDEIKAFIADKKNVLVLGCRGCVTVCSVGGDKEVATLASQLRIEDKTLKQEREISEASIERQCDREYIEPILKQIKAADAVLSLACGVGVQYVTEVASEALDEPVAVIPAINTTFIGTNLEQGVWSERCQMCGNCMLGVTGGLCPIARCSKSLFNGPCGGSADGKCEINSEVDCIWQLIHDQLSKMGQIERLYEVLPVRDWSTSRDGGPRKRIREDLKK